LVLDKATRALFPFIRVIFADGGYQGTVAATKVMDIGDWRLQIVKRSDPVKGFVVLPKRWVVLRRTMLRASASSGRPLWSDPYS